MLTAITGINWGDEGKGRMVDLISQEYDIVARYQGGNNAGHTVKNERGKFVLNLLPSGILRPNVVCVMGNGMVIDPHHLDGEINKLREQGIEITPANLKISDRATITMPYHVEQDGLEEARLSKTGAQFGSTKRGIAYAYGDKYMKKTLRMGDLLHLDDAVKKRLVTMVDSKNLVMEGSYNAAPISVDEMWAWLEKYAAIFKDYICDVGQYLADADAAGKKVLFEAQLGALRDIDFGIYPYTTSSNVIGAYAPIGAGIPGHKLNNSIGVMKAYSSCVGDGPFAAELAMTEEEKHALREAGHEYGAATGRPRRVGPIDLVASRYGVFCQGCDEVALTLLDVLDYMEKIPMVTAYKLTDGTTTTRFPMGGGTPVQDRCTVRLHQARHCLRLRRQVHEKDPAHGRSAASGRRREEASGHHGGFQESGHGGQLQRSAHQRGRDVGMARKVCRHLQGLYLRCGSVSGRCRCSRQEGTV